jgi:hypothetical protein
VEPERTEAGTPDSLGRELTASCANIRGRIEWVDGAGSNTGAEIWLVDHGSGSVTARAVQADGSYHFECGLFLESNILSLHLIREQILVGDFDLAPAEDGVQAAFSYAGGIGFDQGTIKIPRVEGGAGFIVGGIPAKVGGGFRVLTDQSAGLNSLGTRLWPISVILSSQLKPVSPFSILQSFYLGYQRPNLYQRDLGLNSMLVFQVSSLESGFVRRVKLLVEKGWLKYSREARDSDDLPGASYWSERDFEVGDEASADLYRAGIFPGIVPKQGYMALFQIFKSAGSILTAPRFLEEVVSFPPKVTAFGTGPGTSVTSIDYGDEAGRNGLTRPFCENGGVRLVVEPPRDGLPEIQGTRFLTVGLKSQIDVEIEYFGEWQSNESALVPESNEFYGFYSHKYAANVDGSLQWVWTPNDRKMVFTSRDGLFGPQKLEIPQELLLSAVSGRTVNLIRLKIIWSNQTTGSTGGTVIWLRKRCVKSAFGHAD